MTKISLASTAFYAAVLFSPCASASPALDNCLLAISETLPPTTVVQRANTRAVSEQTVSVISGTQSGGLIKAWVQADVTLLFAGRAINKTYFCGDHINGTRVIYQRDAPDSKPNIWVVP